MKSEEKANQAVEKYADTVFKVCFVHLKNHHDTEDIFQEVFLKYLLHDEDFQNEAHEKAWLIRVSINACKDTLKSFYRRKVTSFEDLKIEPSVIPEKQKGILEEVIKLPLNYRKVIYLFYYEGYSALEIATILKKKKNTIYTWLARARALLKERLGGDLFE